MLSRREARRTAAWIAGAQERTGAIPWGPGGVLDPWDHVQAAMGLAAAGRVAEAARAYAWTASAQRVDGSLALRYRNGRPTRPAGEASGSLYLAVGLYHQMLVTARRDLVVRLWPAVRAAADFALGLQGPGGAVRWVREVDGRPWPEALLAGGASLYQSLRCALALAEVVGESRPGWELATARLGHALVHHPERFADRGRHAMDWYYPVLVGAVPGTSGRRRLVRGWRRFVVAGRGVRCVADRPWVTAAETCELALSLVALGLRDAAARLVTSIQHLRDGRGGYWTGLVWPEDARWPVERTTWTAATVLLADDAVAGGATRRLVVGEGLAPVRRLSCTGARCGAAGGRGVGGSGLTVPRRRGAGS